MFASLIAEVLLDVVTTAKTVPFMFAGIVTLALVEPEIGTTAVLRPEKKAMYVALELEGEEEFVDAAGENENEICPPAVVFVPEVTFTIAIPHQHPRLTTRKRKRKGLTFRERLHRQLGIPLGAARDETRRKRVDVVEGLRGIECTGPGGGLVDGADVGLVPGLGGEDRGGGCQVGGVGD